MKCQAQYWFIFRNFSSDFNEDELAVLAGSADEDDSDDDDDEGDEEDQEEEMMEGEDGDMSDKEDVVEDFVMSSEEDWRHYTFT